MPFTESEIQDALSDLFLNFVINDYALEEVLFGNLKPGDKFPVDKFIKDMHFDFLTANDFSSIVYEGHVIDEYGIIEKKDPEYFRKHFYNYEMSCIFADAAPEDKNFDDIGLMIFNNDAMTAYINDNYTMFCEIIDTPIEYDEFSLLLPVKSEVRKGCTMELKQFIADIMLKKLKVGKNVNKYFDKMVYVPYFVEQLVEKRKDKYFLKINDTESLDYKLAAFSVFDFFLNRNAMLLELKSKQWLENKT